MCCKICETGEGNLWSALQQHTSPPSQVKKLVKETRGVHHSNTQGPPSPDKNLVKETCGQHCNTQGPPSPEGHIEHTEGWQNMQQPSMVIKP